MPKAYAMTWERARHRWRKMYRGKVYVVTPEQLNRPSTKEDSWQAANEWWASKVKSLDLPSLDPASNQVQHVLEATPLDDLRRLIDRGQAAAKIVQLLTTADSVFLERRGSTLDPDPSRAAELLMLGQPIADEALATVPALDKVAATIAAAPRVDPDRSVQHHVERWSALQMGSDKSSARKKMNCHMLGYFARFLGNVDVASINEARWEEFYHWLRPQQLDGDYKRRIMTTAKSFLQHLFDSRIIEAIPRNVKNKLLTFKGHVKAVKPEADDTVKQFYAAATGQTKLHVLLMCNTGMTAQDITDLRDDEVDWNTGTLTRKRSKGEDHANVPTVTYRLWPETFKLLKQWRSGTTIVLLTKSGRPWIEEAAEGQPYKHSDSIASNFKNTTRRSGVKLSPTQLRTAAASKLGQHHEYKFYHDYFLGHSPRTVSEKHYLQPSQAEFFEALAWLGKQYGFC